MARHYLIIVLTILTSSCFAQADSTDYYIKRLDNSQFHIELGYIGSYFRTDSPAELALVKIGKPATKKLIVALHDSTKTIMAHLVLSWIYKDKGVGMSGPKFKKINGRSISEYALGEENTVRLLINKTDSNDGPIKYFFSRDNLTQVIDYWNKKTP